MIKKELRSSCNVIHIAIIQDGNRRFARDRGISTMDGHSQGAMTTDLVCDWCLELGIKHLTIYAFSTENFNRGEEEKRYLFQLIGAKLEELSRSKKIHSNKIRVRAIGRIDLLPEDLQARVAMAEQATRGYDHMFLNVALAYGGQCELADAAQMLAREVREGRLRAKDVDEDTIARYLYPYDGIPVPKVDLIIRTGGDLRTSNFLPWQANGNECAAYFCAPYWPEFRKIDFLRALRTAHRRKSAASTGL